MVVVKKKARAKTKKRSRRFKLVGIVQIFVLCSFAGLKVFYDGSRVFVLNSCGRQLQEHVRPREPRPGSLQRGAPPPQRRAPPPPNGRLPREPHPKIRGQQEQGLYRPN